MGRGAVGCSDYGRQQHPQFHFLWACLIESLSPNLSINPNSGNMQCAIKCASTDDCGAFYWETSICHLAESGTLRKPWLGSAGSRSVYTEEAKWLSNNKLTYSIGEINVFQESNVCIFPLSVLQAAYFLCHLGLSNHPDIVCIHCCIKILIAI